MATVEAMRMGRPGVVRVRSDVEFFQQFSDEVGVELLFPEHVEQLVKPIDAEVRSLLLSHSRQQLYLSAVLAGLVAEGMQLLPPNLHFREGLIA